jgi:enoyl-CoA hydratase
MTIDHVVDYSRYQNLLFEHRENGILWITINRPEALNTTTARLHTELCEVWKDVTLDKQTKVAVITGAGRAFSAGGDAQMLKPIMEDFDALAVGLQEVGDIVYNVIECPKPIISAINGVAIGAALGVALLADISIIAKEARLSDGHMLAGVAAGDHAVLLWPLLCGMAKAKHYLLTAEFIDGETADRVGLVSMSVPRADLEQEAMRQANILANGPQWAIRWTKRSLNLWLKQAAPMFDASLAFEALGFLGPDIREAWAAIEGNRTPRFPSAT